MSTQERPELMTGMEEAGSHALLNLRRMPSAHAPIHAVPPKSGENPDGVRRISLEEPNVKETGLEADALKDISGTTAAAARRMTPDERDLMLYKRKLRNRESARKSRLRKKQNMPNAKQMDNEKVKTGQPKEKIESGPPRAEGTVVPSNGMYATSEHATLEPISSDSRDPREPATPFPSKAPPLFHQRTRTPNSMLSHSYNSSEKAEDNGKSHGESNSSRGVHSPPENSNYAEILIELQQEMDTFKERFDAIRGNISHLCSENRRLEEDNFHLRERLAKMHPHLSS
eukprot:Plantae.Rhodophyta-Purpureofilum_apyrenoidigerum.ctg20689.p1 GENE.Plantae.Rhodophyta-Purpureofilum_apyrenoidigerum.ctg20689~~Plantae.Rhodophyta-Purpureofilum_apyrenoidigerum.ctg20689.p1  ORF type:complete len:286 (-),score=41.91 Plantae.Rhodophyta-Purpureofilum_apyrenoidigerum.ctg20689:509-1366(-)